MSNIVLQLSKTEQQRIHDAYAPYYVERQAPGVLFAAKLPNAAVTSYRSGKVLFQGNGAQEEADKWLTPPPVTKQKKKKPTNTEDVLPPNFSNLSVAGSDETGTGDYFGPITVAAVYVPSDKIELLRELDVRDSKELTDAYMQKIAPLLMQALDYSLLVLRNDKYNELQAKGYSQGKMKAMLHNQALYKLLEKIAPAVPEHILIDQFAIRKTYYNHLKGQPNIVEEGVLFATKAENLHVSVAAASIIARYAFLKEMDKLSKQVGVTILKGATSKVDVVAARILKMKGEDVLKSVTKWHFANTDKAKAILAR